VNHKLGGGKRIESVKAHPALFSSKEKDSANRLRHTNNVGVWSVAVRTVLRQDACEVHGA
jgi:hypothetical protein